MAIDFEVFEGKTLSDVFKDIYDNSNRNKEQLEVLMKEVVGFIKDGDTAVQIIPMLKEYSTKSGYKQGAKNFIKEVIKKLAKK